MIGATYGRNLALATVAAYIVEGAIGLPFFAAGGGVAILAGPTAGYLLGFLIAAGVVGHLANRGMGRSVASAMPIFILGDVVIFLCGVAWLRPGRRRSGDHRRPGALPPCRSGEDRTRLHPAALGLEARVTLRGRHCSRRRAAGRPAGPPQGGPALPDRRRPLCR